MCPRALAICTYRIRFRVSNNSTSTSMLRSLSILLAHTSGSRLCSIPLSRSSSSASSSSDSLSACSVSRLSRSGGNNEWNLR